MDRARHRIAIQSKTAYDVENGPVPFSAFPALDETGTKLLEVTKALAALQPLYGKDNIEIVTEDGSHVRGIIRSMKTTQALTKPSVKIERADGQLVKIAFDSITQIIDHNPA